MHGWVGDIEKATLDNDTFRTASDFVSRPR